MPCLMYALYAQTKGRLCIALAKSKEGPYYEARLHNGRRL